MEVEIFNQTNKEIPELKELKDFLIDVCLSENIEKAIFNVIIVDNNEIKKLNKEYRNIDSETDVISFALEDEKGFNNKDIRMLGDIYISLDKVNSQHLEYNHSFKRELFFLALHGFLHLLGYDHMTIEDEKIMFGKQEEILEKYNINR